jgi:hypothetical protein
MKIALISSVVAVSLLTTAAAYATGRSSDMPGAFGPVHTMMINGHEMHVQAFKDTKGGQWVVMSREDAETMAAHKFADEIFQLTLKDDVLGH